jgi:hypothetical protein
MNNVRHIPDVDDPLLTRAELCAESTGEPVSIARQLGADDRRVLFVLARRRLDGRRYVASLTAIAERVNATRRGWEVSRLRHT